MVRANPGFAIIPWLSVPNEKDDYKHFKEPQSVGEARLVVSDTFTRKLILEKMDEAIVNYIPRI
ncbi:hypothetical protein [Chryseosolibacter indicus]|uniref:Uncharacterized protein n=1 Tax=Chryseosolibacter indicus TaxID=2782351 RepID=A0ABS5VYD3_9BACT|nr:hypothetical protein [Chryseosolibacter indicus]MBT1705929.1 hypothetical protein [Chryseosolibacter indicus]